MKMQLELVEYRPLRLAAADMPVDVGAYLWRVYDAGSGQLRVAFPSPATGGQWQLTAPGWVGHVPLPGGGQLTVLPKAPLRRLFDMWAVAYGWADVPWLPGWAGVTPLPGFYQLLAHALARRVLHRLSRGIYRAYRQEEGPLPAVRGRLLWNRQLADTAAAPICRYQLLTADVADNQIVAAALERMARSGLCAGEAQAAVNRARRLLQGVVTLRPVAADECVGRPYTRLNADYRALHALSRFFLAHTVPETAVGAQPMLPFLVDMARLFEDVVAAWLRRHLPPPWQLRAQEAVRVGRAGGLQLTADLVLLDGAGRPEIVLDTKYKTPHKADNADVSQVVTYAQALGCREAVLVYPAPLPQPLDVRLQDLRVRTLAFGLADDLDVAGRGLLAALLE
ncbi:MAG: hypothetical protein KC425_10690 [Anaerolineales bacterium]|nr:hypothetical protein [Anaerolineales bacterium]